MTERPHWVKAIPASRMVFPETFLEKIKYFFWRFYTPFHPWFRDISLRLGLVEHSGRQNFLIGKVPPGQSIRDFVNGLVALGFGNHFIAWIDEGEVAGLRYVKDFKYQYHIRIFEDGEVRAHFEYTPECFPFLHLNAVDQQDCRHELIEMLGDRIVLIDENA